MTEKLNRIIIFTLCVLLLSFAIPNTQCDLFKNGRFHYYSKDSKAHYVVIRKDSLQSEIDTKTGDTSFWKIKWLSNCEFHCSYISGTKNRSKEDQDFYEKSTLQFSILQTSTRYYVYDALFKSGLFTRQFNDTMWVSEK